MFQIIAGFLTLVGLFHKVV